MGAQWWRKVHVGRQENGEKSAGDRCFRSLQQKINKPIKKMQAAWTSKTYYQTKSKKNKNKKNQK